MESEGSEFFNKCAIYATPSADIFGFNLGHGYSEILQCCCLAIISLLGQEVFFELIRTCFGNYGRRRLLQQRDSDPNYYFSEYAISDSVWFLWMLDLLFLVTEADIGLNIGNANILLQAFQCHVIFLAGAVTIVSLLGGLPLMWREGLTGDPSRFAYISLSNLDPRSWALYILVLYSIAMSFIIFLAMRNYLSRDDIRSNSDNSTTLMITNIPENQSTEVLFRHFREAYPECEIQNGIHGVNFAINRRSVQKAEIQRDIASKAKRFSQEAERDGHFLKVFLYKCGNLLSCWGLFKFLRSTDAVPFYESEENRHRIQVESETTKVASQPLLNVAFVTFTSVQHSSRIYKDHQRNWFKARNFRNSSFSEAVLPGEWSVDFAPPEDDIVMKNVKGSSRMWYLQFFGVLVGLFTLLFGLTTTSMVVFVLDYFDLTKNMSTTSSNWLRTILWFTTSTLMPKLIDEAVDIMNFWRKSKANLVKMVLSTVFLIVMAGMLPSLGLTNLKTLIFWAVQEKVDDRWACVFRPENGIFFIMHIASDIGAVGLKFLNPWKLTKVIWQSCSLRSRAEVKAMYRAELENFGVAEGYACTIYTFSLMTIYSFCFPLITPFGFLALVLNFYGDRYAMVYATSPSRIDNGVHRWAAFFLLFSVFLLQTTLLCYTLFRAGNSGISYFALCSMLLTIVLVFMDNIIELFHWCRRRVYIFLQPTIEMEMVEV